MTYDLAISVGNNKIHCRKWKGKDKKNFMAAIKKPEISELEVMESLVYSCIQEDVVLDVEEFRYVLSRIRAHSLGENIHIEFYCDECGNLYEKDFDLKNIIRYSFQDKPVIKSKDCVIKLGPIKNKELYAKYIKEDDIFDLLFRIESFNENKAFTLDSLIDLFDELDIDVISDIIKQYEDSKFKVEDVNTVECTHCKAKTQFKFDELPGFFPDSWFE